MLQIEFCNTSSLAFIYYFLLMAATRGAVLFVALEYSIRVLQWMGCRSQDLNFQISCHLSYSFVVCLLHFTMGIVSELVLPLMLQIRGYPMLKSAS